MRTLFITHTQELATNPRQASRRAASQPRLMATYRGAVAGYRVAVVNDSANEGSAQEPLP